MTLIRKAALNTALYTFISLNPYIRWVLPNEIFYIVFLISTSIYSFKIKAKVKDGLVFNSKRYGIFFILIIFIVYFTTPLVHELRLGHLVWPIPFLFVIFYNDEIIRQAYYILKKIIVWVSIFALVIWVLKLVSIPLPYYSFQPDFRYFSSDYYRIYGFAVSLYTHGSATGIIFGLERITGVFAEPGHFGIYLGIMLAIEKFNFQNQSNKILLLAGFLTFSTAFYGIFAMGLFYRFLREKKFSKNLLYPITFAAFITIVGFVLFGGNFLDMIYGRILSRNIKDFSIVTLIDSRVSNNFINQFNSLSNKPEFFTGLGYSDIDLATTNWRGVIFRFGVIGLAILIAIFIAITRRVNILYALLLISISILVLAHRSYLLYTPGIFILIYFATSIHHTERLINNSFIKLNEQPVTSKSKIHSLTIN